MCLTQKGSNFFKPQPHPELLKRATNSKIKRVTVNDGRPVSQRISKSLAREISALPRTSKHWRDTVTPRKSYHICSQIEAPIPIPTPNKTPRKKQSKIKYRLTK